VHFSERYGLKPVKDVFQVGSMDEDLRNGLWNVLDLFCFGDRLRKMTSAYVVAESSVGELCDAIWIYFFNEPRDEMPTNCQRLHYELKKRYFHFKWHEVYAFLELVVANDERLDEQEFIHACKYMLKRELSGWRFVGKVIAPIINEVEIAEIEEALDQTTPLAGAKAHLSRALELLSDREDPDYRNSMKESISAVEAIAQMITGDPNATLGAALKKIDQSVELHPALNDGFMSIYGYASDADGIRHGSMEKSNLSFDDAKFMLVSCSAFVNYLIAKSQEAGIDLSDAQEST